MKKRDRAENAEGLEILDDLDALMEGIGSDEDIDITSEEFANENGGMVQEPETGTDSELDGDFELDEDVDFAPAKNSKEALSFSEKKGQKSRKKKRRTSVPLLLALVLCILVLGVSIWQLSGIFLGYKAAVDEYEDLQQFVFADVLEETFEEDADSGEDEETEPEEDVSSEEQVVRVALSELKGMNSDTIGWLEIPGTGINYPLMHTSDNAYYLNHTFSGKENSSGSIFLETLNRTDFTDLHTLIYGHNMKNGSMFAGLKNYESASYLVAHPTVYIDLEDGTHAYRIFSIYEAAPDDSCYTIGFGPDEVYEEWLADIKEKSVYDTGVDVSVEDSVITLSTCTGNGEMRYVVHAKKVY